MLSKPLESWLIAEPSDERAIATVSASDILRSEAAMALPALRQAALRPATHDEIKGIIGSRFATFPQPKRSEGEAAAFWADYFDALEGLTPAQVEGGMAAYIREPHAEFLPKPGRLRELATSSASIGRWTRAHARARAAVERSRQADRPALADDSRPSAEEVQALLGPVLEKLAGIDAKRAAKAKPRQPTPSAMVDGSGTSSEMRQLWQRQGYNPHPAQPEPEGKAA